MNALKLGHFAGSSVALATASMAFFAAAAVHAQGSPAASGGIEEVVVTATRREEALQDVPLSVTAVSAESLEARNVSSIADLRPGTIPGVFITQFAGTASVLSVNIRGVGLSDSTQATQELAVPIYIDGVPLARGQGLGLDLIDPERIEVLRGPQGQLFGRNAEGGAVQFVSRKPGDEFAATASVSFGNYADRKYKLSVDLPVSDTFALQLSGVKHEHDGYTTNINKGTYSRQDDYALLDTKGFRIAARWQPSDRFTLDYTYDDTDTFDSQPLTTWVPVPIVGRTAAAAQPSTTDYPDATSFPIWNLGFDVLSKGHALTLSWELSDNYAFKSITGRRESGRSGSSTLTAVPAGASSRGFFYPSANEIMDSESTSQEFQFLGSWDNFDLTAGATYFKEDVNDRRISILTGPGIAAGALGIQPAVPFCIGLETCKTGDNQQKADSKSYGVYAQGTYRPASLDGKLELTAGLRYSKDEKNALRFAVFNPVPQPGTAVPVNFRSKFDTSRVDPAFVIKYNWSENLNTYLRYATGYRAGGANVRSSTFSSYDEEVNKAIELGLKSQFADGRVTFNVALYRTRVTDQQLNIQEQPITNPSLTNTVNGAPLTAKGIEIELGWRPIDQLTLGLNYSFMDGEDILDIDNPLTAAVDLTRFYPISQPDNSGSVSLDYRSNELGLGRLKFHADYSFADDYWQTPGAQLVASFGTGYKRPAGDSSQLNARLSWGEIALGNAEAEISLWGKNLTDDAGIVYGFDGAAFGGGFATFRAAPRTYGVELRVAF